MSQLEIFENVEVRNIPKEPASLKFHMKDYYLMGLESMWSRDIEARNFNLKGLNASNKEEAISFLISSTVDYILHCIDYDCQFLDMEEGQAIECFEMDLKFMRLSQAKNECIKHGVDASMLDGLSLGKIVNLAQKYPIKIRRSNLRLLNFFKARKGFYTIH